MSCIRSKIRLRRLFEGFLLERKEEKWTKTISDGLADIGYSEGDCLA